MALHGTLTHWKTRVLANQLGIDQASALGLLEALWHVTSEDAPSGNIGRLSNKAIAMQMYSNINPDQLIDALVESGHLDEHPIHRLIVHDWHIHADYNTKRKVKRRGALMHTVNGDVQPVADDDASSPVSDASSPVITRLKSMPVPVPVPEPVPEPVPGEEPKGISEAKASSPRPPVGDVPKPSIAPPVEWPAWDGPPEPTVLPPVNPEQWIYDAYPRREGHLEAIKAIKAALRRIQKGESIIPPIPDLREARIYLYRRVQTYARSPAGSRADKTLIPHPKTWFGQARYLDDESNWQHTGEERYENPKNIGTNNIANLTAAVRKNRDRIDANGNLSEGDAGHCDPGTLLGAIVERKR